MGPIVDGSMVVKHPSCTMSHMTTRTPHPDTALADTPHADSEQLTLLDTGHVPLQFRLDRQTRLRGLAHVAQIRRQLAERRTRGVDQQAA
jgi:hypothetical protein